MSLLTSELHAAVCKSRNTIGCARGLGDFVINGIRTAISDTGNDYTLEPKTKETERRKHILLFCFVLFWSLSFNLFLCFFHADIAETSHFPYKTENEIYNESTHPS